MALTKIGMQFLRNLTDKVKDIIAQQSTTGFGILLATPVNIVTGVIKLERNGSLWISHGHGAFVNAAAIFGTGGSKQIVGTLDRIRITTVNGTDQFDAGTINVSWEF